jgi:hypothetical protein
MRHDLPRRTALPAGGSWRTTTPRPTICGCTATSASRVIAWRTVRPTTFGRLLPPGVVDRTMSDPRSARSPAAGSCASTRDPPPSTRARKPASDSRSRAFASGRARTLGTCRATECGLTGCTARGCGDSGPPRRR